MASPGPEIKSIISRYCQQLREMGIRVERVILFGSQAHTQTKEGTDIDLLIVSSDFEQISRRERLELLGVATARLWQPIDAVAYTPKELVNVEPGSFLEEILETGVNVA